jgi:hydrogenase maturation protease
MSDRVPLLILGLGNVLLGDDGVGSAAVARLRDEYDYPGDVHVLDGGTLGLALLPYVEEAEAVILVDAIQDDGPAGTFVRLDGDDVAPAVATRLSPHQVGVADLLDGARWRDRYPGRVALLGLVPESIDLGVGLSAPVAANLDQLIGRVVDEAAALGFLFLPKVEHGTPAADGRVDVARLVGMS